MRICIDVDEDMYAALKLVKSLYPEFTLKEFVNIVIKPQLQRFLRRNLENTIQQLNWTYRVVMSVLSK